MEGAGGGLAGPGAGGGSARRQVRGGASRLPGRRRPGRPRAWAPLAAALLFPFLAKGRGRSGKSCPRPRNPEGQASGKLRRRAQPARLRVASCGPAPVTGQGLRGPRGASAPPRLQARSWLLGPENRHALPPTGAAISTHLRPRLEARAAARAERLTWAQSRTRLRRLGSSSSTHLVCSQGFSQRCKYQEIEIIVFHCNFSLHWKTMFSQN